MRRRTVVMPLALLSFALLLIAARARAAQIQNGWSVPFRLSTGRGDATEATLVADSYGYVHAFWLEIVEDDIPLIQYARFDGGQWTMPVDIYAGGPFATVTNITVAIDDANRLHLMWSASQDGPVFYIHAPAHKALSARDWAEPVRADIPASFVALKVDSSDRLHLLFTREGGTDAGVYYATSSNGGLNWSLPFWLDPDILPDHQPAWLQFHIDESGGLHASWYYIAQDASGGDWVRYAHSLDGGETWSAPFTIDRLTEEEISAEQRLSAAYPVMALQGDNIHLIWAGGKLHYRHHSYSTDRGRTWSKATQPFGSLNGQAGDGMVVDGAGRIHFFSQIRYPQAIHHAVWDGGSWTSPEIVYLISTGGDDLIGDRIHAHRTFPVIRNGNQLVLTFTDPPPEPGRRLFYTSLLLDDVPATKPDPTPQPQVMPTGEATTTAAPAPLATEVAPGASVPTEASPNPDGPIWLGLAPALLLAGAVILFQLFSRRLP